VDNWSKEVVELLDKDKCFKVVLELFKEDKWSKEDSRLSVVWFNKEVR